MAKKIKPVQFEFPGMPKIEFPNLPAVRSLPDAYLELCAFERRRRDEEAQAAKKKKKP